MGDDATHRGLTPQHRASEILLRLSARSARREGLELFRKLLPSMILSGPAGVAVTGGAPALSEVVSYWPALMPRAMAPALVRLLEERGTGRLEQVQVTGPLPWPETPGPVEAGPRTTPTRPSRTRAIRCECRSCASPMPAAATRATPPTSA